MDVNDVDSITKGLKLGLESNLRPLTDQELDELSYSNTADQIFRVTKK